MDLVLTFALSFLIPFSLIIGVVRIVEKREAKKILTDPLAARRFHVNCIRRRMQRQGATQHAIATEIDRYLRNWSSN